MTPVVGSISVVSRAVMLATAVEMAASLPWEVIAEIIAACEQELVKGAPLDTAAAVVTDVEPSEVQVGVQTNEDSVKAAQPGRGNGDKPGSR